MKKEIKKLWVEALRSGKYIQGQKMLKLKEQGVVKHCCLGVLAELYKEGTKLTLDLEGNAALRPEVMQWAGLSSCFGDEVTIDKHTTRLASHNDSQVRPISFLQIADAIEAQL